MEHGSGSRRPPTQRIFAGVVILVSILAIVGLVMIAIALRQERSMKIESRAVVMAPFADSEPGVRKPPISLRFDLSSVQLILLPAAEGEVFSIEASFDPEHYQLERLDSPDSSPGSPISIDLSFSPRSPTLAFVRMKLGEELPVIEVRVPPDQPFSLKGQTSSSFAAIEAGGLTLTDFELEVEGGAATVSFLEPVAEPIQSFVLVGSTGSVEVTGLGNASPGSALIEHRLGEIDIDARGAWQRDAQIDFKVQFAGGSLWLPRDATVLGLAGSTPTVTLESREGPALPRLDFSLSERAGRLVLIR